MLSVRYFGVCFALFIGWLVAPQSATYMKKHEVPKQYLCLFG